MCASISNQPFPPLLPKQSCKRNGPRTPCFCPQKNISSRRKTKTKDDEINRILFFSSFFFSSIPPSPLLPPPLSTHSPLTPPLPPNNRKQKEAQQPSSPPTSPPSPSSFPKFSPSTPTAPTPPLPLLPPLPPLSPPTLSVTPLSSEHPRHCTRRETLRGLSDIWLKQWGGLIHLFIYLGRLWMLGGGREGEGWWREGIWGFVWGWWRLLGGGLWGGRMRVKVFFFFFFEIYFLIYLFI